MVNLLDVRPKRAKDRRADYGILDRGPFDLLDLTAGLELEATAARLLTASTNELQVTLQDLMVQVVAWSRQPGGTGR